MLRFLLNVLWFVLGGFVMGLGWWLAGLVAAITIVGIPRPRTLFVEHQPLIEQWLEEGTASAAEILRRLIRLAPEKYHEGQLRSMERRVREWRTARAEQVMEGMRSAGKGARTGDRPIPVATPIGGNT